MRSRAAHTNPVSLTSETMVEGPGVPQGSRHPLPHTDDVNRSSVRVVPPRHHVDSLAVTVSAPHHHRHCPSPSPVTQITPVIPSTPLGGKRTSEGRPNASTHIVSKRLTMM